MKSRFIYIIIAIMLVILVAPFIRHSGLTGHLITTLITAMIPLSTFYALTADRNRAILILIIATHFVILDGMSMFFAHSYLLVTGISFGIVLYFYIVVLLVRKLLSYRVVTADLIYCAISTYFLIGVMWSGIYTVLEGIYPDSFSGITEAGDFLYFSFVILTTVGFGDITPQTIISKRLVIFEAATGCIYLAVIIAMIVGRYMSMEQKQGSKDD